MISLLKVIAFGMIATVCSKLFPTFWGGFYTFLALSLVSIFTSVKVAVKK